MNLRFPTLVLISAALHVFVIWAIAVDRPPVLLLTHGEISVDCLPSPAAEPRPLLTRAEKKPVKQENEKPVPKLLKELPKPKPEVRVAEKRPEEKKVPEKPPLKVERPAVPQPPKKSEPKQAKPPEPAPPKPAEQPKVSDTKPLPAQEPRSPALTSSLPQQASLPSVLKTQGVKTEARLLGSQKPDYPKEAQLRGLEGEVVISLDLSADGRVVKAKLHKSSGHDILDDSALRFAEALEFVPARQGTTPVPANVLLPIRYRLVDPR